MNVNPLVASSGVTHDGKYGTKTFKLYLTEGGGRIKSAWHDVPLYAEGSAGLVNFIVEVRVRCLSPPRGGGMLSRGGPVLTCPSSRVSFSPLYLWLGGCVVGLN
jgi:hypothetical protein